MPSRIIVHHSCCSETPFSQDLGRGAGSFLIHVDGTVSKFSSGCSLAALPVENIHIFLIGYFNSCSNPGAADSRQMISLAELLRQLINSRDDLFGQLICHHQFCPGYRFPWEELEWRLWKMFS